MSTLQERLNELLARKFGVPAEALRPDNTLEDVGFDSLAVIELALALQEGFGIPVRDDELSTSDSLARVAALVADKGVAVP